MIRHIVLIQFRADVAPATIDAIFVDLAAIKNIVPGVVSITYGKSQSPEQIERGYMHGFVVDFADWAALAVYQEHPDHKSVGARLIANAIGGLDGILVFDMPVEH